MLFNSGLQFLESVCLSWKPSQFDEKRKLVVDALKNYSEKMIDLAQYTMAFRVQSLSFRLVVKQMLCSRAVFCDRGTEYV